MKLGCGPGGVILRFFEEFRASGLLDPCSRSAVSLEKIANGQTVKLEAAHSGHPVDDLLMRSKIRAQTV